MREGAVIPDPVTLTVLGGVAATEGIKFLYGQAAELLKAWRERRKKAREQAVTEPRDLDVPILPSAVLDAQPVARHADGAIVERTHSALVELSGALSPYALGQVDVDLTDAELAGRVGRLRALLETIYGQRFTFRGEEREPTGSEVAVHQALGAVEGNVLGAEADVGAGGDLLIEQRADRVGEKGSVTGFKGTIGGSSDHPAP
ncbi:MAG: hypothetical protein M3460_25080 [Actinomycetota bacterium]|nr:hypothetical protein [Actinomycetota bacterium]